MAKPLFAHLRNGRVEGVLVSFNTSEQLLGEPRFSLLATAPQAQGMAPAWVERSCFQGALPDHPVPGSCLVVLSVPDTTRMQGLLPLQGVGWVTLPLPLQSPPPQRWCSHAHGWGVWCWSPVGLSPSPEHLQAAFLEVVVRLRESLCFRIEGLHLTLPADMKSKRVSAKACAVLGVACWGLKEITWLLCTLVYSVERPDRPWLTSGRPRALRGGEAVLAVSLLSAGLEPEHFLPWPP